MCKAGRKSFFPGFFLAQVAHLSFSVAGKWIHKFYTRMRTQRLQVTMLPVPFSRMSKALHLFLICSYEFLFSSIVGRPRHQGVMVGMGQKDSYVGFVSAAFLVIHLSDLAII